jgi:hypothetical protein
MSLALQRCNGFGAKVGTLANGSQVYIGKPCQNGWCQVNTNQIPRGFGFVEQNRLQISN